MNEQASKALAEIVTKCGQGIADDPRRLRALLGDHCPGMKREVNVLVAAAEHKMVADLQGSTAGIPWPSLSGRLVRKMSDELGTDSAAARWAIEAWGVALGIAVPPTKGAPPEPVQSGSDSHTAHRQEPLAIATAPPRKQERQTTRAQAPIDTKRRLTTYRVLGLPFGLLLLIVTAVLANTPATRLPDTLHLNGEPVEMAGSVDFLFESTPAGTPSGQRSFYEIEPQEVSKLLMKRSIQAPQGVLVEERQLSVTPRTISTGSRREGNEKITYSGKGYRISGQWAVTPSADFSESELKIRVALPGVASIRDELKATSPTGETAIEMVARTFSSPMGLYAVVLPYLLISLLAAGLAVTLILISLIQFNTVSSEWDKAGSLDFVATPSFCTFIGMIFLLITLILYVDKIIFNNAFIMFTYMQQAHPVLLAAGLAVTNTVGFLISWLLCGRLRWSRLWVFLILPPTLVQIALIITSLRSDPVERWDLVLWLPLATVVGQASALLIAALRRERPLVGTAVHTTTGRQFP
jgi:hypothetical protein